MSYKWKMRNAEMVRVVWIDKQRIIKRRCEDKMRSLMSRVKLNFIALHSLAMKNVCLMCYAHIDGITLSLSCEKWKFISMEKEGKNKSLSLFILMSSEISIRFSVRQGEVFTWKEWKMLLYIHTQSVNWIFTFSLSQHSPNSAVHVVFKKRKTLSFALTEKENAFW